MLVSRRQSAGAEHVTIADVARGELPAAIEELAANPDAWQPH